jgi:hypothetical protein
MPARTVLDRLDAPGPKRILACDGGGILGLISVEILARLEDELRSATGNPQLVLGDWFDLVCGTSTGAIVAACLAAGMDVASIRTFYVGSGRAMFTKSGLLERLRYSYDDEPLARTLREALNVALGRQPTDAPAELGDAGLRTLLMMVMRNHSTDSPWPIANNPRAKYNDRARPDCNLQLPLWQLVRASTAAPTYFPPETVTLGRGTAREKSFVFVDGGVTTYNNPAFLAYQMATAAPYRIGWRTGVENLLIVSVGTGSAPFARPDLKASDLWLLDHAKNIPGALMNAASAGWDMACRTVGQCRHGRDLDREIGTMQGEAMATGAQQFAYVRYDPDVSQAGLDALGLPQVRAGDVQTLDSIDHIPAIQSVGVAYAQQQLGSAALRAQLRGFI